MEAKILEQQKEKPRKLKTKLWRANRHDENGISTRTRDAKS